jgi:photosystem II stability/assembly factor-like uncharacterized protein
MFDRLTSLFILSMLSVNCIAQNWTEVETPLNIVTDIGSHNGQLTIVGSRGSQMYYATSSDEGETWDTLNITGQSEIAASPMYIGFFNENEGTIGIKGSFAKDYLKTEDGGETWTSAEMQLDTSCNNLLQPYDFYQVNDQVGIINGFQSGRYMVTRDGGQTWGCSDDFITSWVPQVYVKNDSVWYTKDNDGFYITRDGGTSWVQAIDKEFIHFQCIGEEIIALSTYFSEPGDLPVLYRTNDEWETYESIPLVEFNQIYLTLFVQTNSGGLYLLESDDVYYSINGNNDFLLIQTLDQEPFRTTYINDTWYLSGRGLARLEDPLSSTVMPVTDVLRVYPNPASDYLEIRLDDLGQEGQFILIDARGSQVLRTPLNARRMIDVSSVPEGIYFYSAQYGSGKVEAGKVVILR